MHHMIKIASSAVALLAGCDGTAHAQNLCKGKVAARAVYTTPTPSTRQSTQKFDYNLQVQNVTNAPIIVSAIPGGFPSTAILHMPSTQRLELKAYETKNVIFGSGADSQINTGTVKIQFDTTAGTGKPTLSFTSCR